MYKDDMKLVFYGEEMTFADYKKRFVDEGCNPETTLNILIRKKMARIVDNVPEDGERERAVKNSNDVAKRIYEGEEVRQSEEDQKDYKERIRTDGELVHEKVELDFPTVYKAQDMQKLCAEDIRLKQSEIVLANGIATLILHNVSESQMAFVKAHYTMGKVSDAMQNGLRVGMKKTNKVIDYGMNQVLVPVAKVGIKGAEEVVKSVVKTVFRTGATAVSSTIDTVKETKEELKSDPDIIKAKGDITKAMQRKPKRTGSAGGMRVY